MIKLGVNASPYLLELLAEGRVEVDYLKVGPWMGREQISRLRELPLLLHCDENLGNNGSLQSDVIQNVAAYVELTATPWASTHIGYACAQVGRGRPGEAIQHFSLALAYDEALANISRNARLLQEHLPVSLLLENIPRFLSSAYEHICEPEFISQVIADTGCELLLDIGHARVSAAVMGYDVYDYLNRLPLEKTVEIHVHGPRLRDGLLWDGHEPLTETDYELLLFALERTPRLRAVSLEYWKSKEALPEQIERLREMTRPYQNLPIHRPHVQRFGAVHAEG